MTEKKTKEKKIPKTFDSVVKAVESVCAEFESEESFQYLGAERWIREIGIEWDDDVEHIAFVLDIEYPLLAAYVVLRLPEKASKKLTELAKAASRVNFGLLPGCFEVDFDTGQVRFRNVMSLHPTRTTIKEVAQLLSNALSITRIYAAAFREIVESGANPLNLIDKVED